MTPQEAFELIVNLVPQWFVADCGPNRRTLTVGEERFSFFSHIPLTPALEGFYATISGSRLDQILALPGSGIPSFSETVQELLALKWLHARHGAINWTEILRYLRFLEMRTYENSPVSVNLVVRNATGTFPVSTATSQKLFDLLAASPFTYLVVDRQLRLVSYDEVQWREVQAPQSYPMYPSFLHPIRSMLGGSDVSVHLTQNRDLLILERNGLLASRRKGHWRIYDVNTFKNSLASIIGHYRVSANLFGLLFDLSFHRHGALLVYDPNHQASSHIINRESLLSENAPANTAHSFVGETIHGVALGGNLRATLPVWRRLVELASIDGAVVFDKYHILAVGAMIEPHPDVGSQFGARTTAALSARNWGGTPIKVSSDGDVTVYFFSEENDNRCPATLEFL